MGRLRFHYDVRVEVFPNEGVLLIWEDGSALLNGRVFELLAPLLRVPHSEEQIINTLENQVPLADLYYALRILKNNNYIVESETGKSLSVTEALLSSLRIDLELAEKNLQQSRVSLSLVGGIKKQHLAAALQSLQIRISKTGFRVIITDDYLRPVLKGWNRKMLKKGNSWMLLKLVGSSIWIGPIFRPWKTGCWECLSNRIKSNREWLNIVDLKQGENFFLTPRTSSTASEKIAANLAAIEIARWLVEEKNERIEGKIVTLDLRTLQLANHILVRRPQCKACGLSEEEYKKDLTPIVLKTNPIGRSQDGLLRSVGTEETIVKLADHVSPITGIISHVVRVTPLNVPVPLYASGYNQAARGRSLYVHRQALRSQSAGKGKTDAEARASAMCEAVERHSGNFTGDETRIRSLFSQVMNAIHPHTLLLYSARQYENRDQHNKCASPLHFIPRPFDLDREVDWSPVWSLTRSEFKYVPTAFCYYSYPQKQEEIFCMADSNGCAAGNTMEEAILQGFLELVERDSVSLWWYNRLSKPAVKISSFDDPYLEILSTFYESIHREFWVLDLTSDLGIPTFAAISRRNDSEIEEIAFGFGCHFDAGHAMMRAVTEMSQLLPRTTLKDPGRDYDWADNHAVSWWQSATVGEHPYLLPVAAAKTSSDYCKHSTTDIRDDVLRSVRIAKDHGLEVLVLDQTRPDIRMPVVKVIVPGLRHFWPRFAPGRLYNVPVERGWLEKPTVESDLNPFSIFL